MTLRKAVGKTPPEMRDKKLMSRGPPMLPGQFMTQMGSEENVGGSGFKRLRLHIFPFRLPAVSQPTDDPQAYLAH